jgi:hypothetical protein
MDTSPAHRQGRHRHAGCERDRTGDVAADGRGRARVIGCDVNENALTAARATLADQAVGVELTDADVTSQEDVDRLVTTAGDRVDVLGNLAAIMDFFLLLGDVDDATGDRVLAVATKALRRRGARGCPLHRVQASLHRGPPRALGDGASPADHGDHEPDTGRSRHHRHGRVLAGQRRGPPTSTVRLCWMTGAGAAPDEPPQRARAQALRRRPLVQPPLGLLRRDVLARVVIAQPWPNGSTTEPKRSPVTRVVELHELLARTMQDRSLVRVDDVAAGPGLSVRTVQRLFATYVGAQGRPRPLPAAGRGLGRVGRRPVATPSLDRSRQRRATATESRGEYDDVGLGVGTICQAQPGFPPAHHQESDHSSSTRPSRRRPRV